MNFYVHQLIHNNNDPYVSWLKFFFFNKFKILLFIFLLALLVVFNYMSKPKG